MLKTIQIEKFEKIQKVLAYSIKHPRGKEFKNKSYDNCFSNLAVTKSHKIMKHLQVEIKRT